MHLISTRQFARPSRLGPMIVALVLAILSFVPWPSAVAAPVSSKQAVAVVKGWLSVDRMPLGETLGTAVQRVETYNDATGAPLYYVAYLESSGYAIVAADDLVEPIVGFATAGQFDPSGNNPLGALVSNDLAGRVAYVRQAGSKPPDTSAVQALAKWQQLCPADGGPVVVANLVTLISNVWVAPLTQTTWSQETAADGRTSACYNYYTPPYGDGVTNNYPSGCVSTAMAQFMRFFQFPTTGVGTASFTIYVNSSPQTYSLHGGDGAGGAYVWANMPLVPPGNPTTAQCQAIGALIADAGATVNMSYTSGGSSSSLWDAKDALLNTFHFSSARYGYNNNNQLGAGLTAMINPNLDAHYPVLLSIRNGSSGHAVVADGYGYSLSTLYHHLNLGWSGTATAWYALPLIDTGPYTFNVVDGCVYNAYTNGGGEIISGRVLDQISRPVVNATVTATRSVGGTYTATTDGQGIYALARIPSASSYSIAVTKSNYAPVTNSFATGTSTDHTATSGNYWGANFTLNMLPTVVDYLSWGTLAATQSFGVPFAATITAFNADGGFVTSFTGPVSLSGYTIGLGAGGTLIGNLTPSGGWSSSSGLTHGYAFTPSTNIQVTAVRAYTGDKVSIWTDSGSNLVNQAISGSGSWTEAALATPVILFAGTTYRVTAHYGKNVVGWYQSTWPTTFANGAVGQAFYTAYGDTFPVQVLANNQGPLIDLRYQVVISNSVPISPSSSGAFVNGVWSGNISVSQVATNVVLKADDNAGHVATTTPFNVITSLLLLSPTPLAGGQFQCTVVGLPGQRLQILASSNLVNWTTNTTLTNTTGTTTYTDPDTGLSRRFYRARQVQ
jgi:hypothetical protein